MDAKLIYLGAYGSEVLAGALSALHLIVWKFVIIAFTKAETEGATFKPRKVWRDAVRRCDVRLRAYVEGVSRWKRRRASQGQILMPAAVRDRHQAILHPCYTVDDEGNTTRAPLWDELLSQTTAEEKKDAAESKRKRTLRARRTN
jgi:hypothetical protein